MIRHAAVLAVAVFIAVAGAQGLQKVAAAHATPVLQPVSAPVPAQDESPQPAEVSKGRDGHYWAEADVNGHWIKFLVDTGASAVALTREDAERLGLDPSNLDYGIDVATADGHTRAAAVHLDHVSVAGVRVDDVPALVVRDGLKSSLLGMSYLGRLSRFEATKTTLILRP